MKYQSVRMVHADGSMHHLGVKEADIAKNVILTPDPMMVAYYAKFMDNAELKGDYREYVTYTGTYNGKPLTVMSCGFGCMPMAIAIEELNHLKATSIIKIDENIAVNDEIKCGDYVAAKAAVRSEGATREYIDISYPAVADMSLLSRMIKLNTKIGLFRSHDVENLDSPYAPGGMDRINKWSNLGVDVFDGETSSMYIVAACLRLRCASLSLIKENYITNEKISVTDEMREKLFKLAAEALLNE